MEPLETRFLALVGENRQRLLRLCRVYARGEQDPEDLYQEVLFQIWRALPGYRGESGADTWLWRGAGGSSRRSLCAEGARGGGGGAGRGGGRRGGAGGGAGRAGG